MPVDISEVRQHVDRDQQHAREIVSAAHRKIMEGVTPPIDITFKTPPAALAAVQKQLAEQQEGLRETGELPFYTKIETQLRGERVTFYVTRAPQLTRLDLPDNEWMLISWYSPVALNLEKEQRNIGQKVEVRVGSIRNVFKIVAAGRYGHVLPKLRNVEYVLESGNIALPDPDVFAGPPAVAEARPAEVPEEIKGRQRGSKRDIIELKSHDQTAALLLPFDKNVLIGGPPGSGKTTIGVMRIKCLIASQAEILGLNLDRGEHRFKPEWTRILVLSEQMVENLEDLINDLYLQGVRLDTFRDFFRVIARECKTLSQARERDESIHLTQLKGEPLALRAVFEAFQSHVRELMRDQGGALRRRMSLELMLAAIRRAVRDRQERIFTEVLEVAEAMPPEDTGTDATSRIETAINALMSNGRHEGSARWRALIAQAAATGESLWKEIEKWAAGVQATALSETFTLPDINLAKRLAAWSERQLNRLNDLSQQQQRIARLLQGAAEDYAERLAAQLIPSVTRLKSIPDMPAYQKLLETAAQIGLTAEQAAKADEAWRAQLEAGNLYSEQDAVIAVWLGSHVAMVAEGARRVIGHRKDKVTHILVDEAQDLSPVHGIAINRLLDEGGTISVAGDLHQRVTEGRGLQVWEQLAIPLPCEAVFPVNERQSKALGVFLLELHQELYGSRPVWRPSESAGPRPRIRVSTDVAEFSATVSEEIREIRRSIPRATVGVLYDDADSIINEQRLEELQEHLESHLQDDVVPVYTIQGKDDTRAINLVDCVKIMSIVRAKGLEFDGTVLIGQGSRWGREINSYGDICKNRLYVGVSRPTSALSIVARSHPTVFDSMIAKGFCALIPER